MNWNRLLSKARLGKETEEIPYQPGRSPFDADTDRIVFSGAFRRLSRKTQVHPLAANDHIHTRLTHSIEASQVGRALGKLLGTRIKRDLPKQVTAGDLGSIVQAACLAHDIGNPPFGHAGEEAMAHWFEINGPTLFGSLSRDYRKDVIFFEGNAQGLRVLTQTENHLFHGGLRLTYATLGTYMKYPWTSRKAGKKFGAYISEEKVLRKIAERLGLKSKGSHEWARHPLAFLVEAADDICYSIIDLEDAVELKILSFDTVAELLLKPLDAKAQEKVKKTFPSNAAHRVNLARLRGPVFDALIDGAIEAFEKKYTSIMAGKFDGELFKALNESDSRRILVSEAKTLSANAVFPDQKKVEIELGSYSTFETLLDAFCTAALERAQHLKSPTDEITLGWKSSLILKLLGDHAPSENNPPPGTSWSQYQCLRRVIDFVSGMTDNYAVYIAKQLQGMAFAGIQRP